MAQAPRNDSPALQPTCAERAISWGYVAVISVLALGIIFGTLLVLTQHYDLNWGPFADQMKHVISYLGDYIAVPLEVCLGAFIPLVVLGIGVKCAAKPPKERQNPYLQGTSVFAHDNYPNKEIEAHI